MIDRTLTSKIQELRHKFPVLSLTGPRQTGKTTLLKSIYTDMPYVTLEDVDSRLEASEDPRGFLANFPHGVVIDEVHHAPDIFSYIQGIVDRGDSHFVLSGSQNFLLSEKISQSLAGRVAILRLLPFSISEIGNHVTPGSFEALAYAGFYPRIYDKQIAPIDFYPSYIQTYIERDVRQIKSIENLITFSLFLKLCAGRVGQVLNMQSLASDVGISPNTVKAWLSVLEASFIIYFLPPHYQNFNKRLIKTPKLYFYDTGVVCSLLGLESSDQLNSHYLKGGVFENMIINEFMKMRYNRGRNPNCYFWRSKDGKEIDLMVQQNGIVPFEIKSAKTRSRSFFDNLKYWNKLSGTEVPSQVIYGGDESIQTSEGRYVSWRDLNQIWDRSSDVTETSM